MKKEKKINVPKGRMLVTRKRLHAIGANGDFESRITVHVCDTLCLQATSSKRHLIRIAKTFCADVVLPLLQEEDSPCEITKFKFINDKYKTKKFVAMSLERYLKPMVEDVNSIGPEDEEYSDVMAVITGVGLIIGIKSPSLEASQRAQMELLVKTSNAPESVKEMLLAYPEMAYMVSELLLKGVEFCTVDKDTDGDKYEDACTEIDTMKKFYTQLESISNPKESSRLKKLTPFCVSLDAQSNILKTELAEMHSRSNYLGITDDFTLGLAKASRNVKHIRRRFGFNELADLIS